MKFKPVAAACRIDTALGPVVLAATEAGLCGLWFDGQRHQIAPDGWPVQPDHRWLRLAGTQLREYLEGRRRRFELPLDLDNGTPFQQAVWRALTGIEHGRTLSYGALAARLDRPDAVRAVAAAVGRNPLSVIVPCHRVLGANGALTGYAGGLARKAALLRLEGNAPGSRT